VFRGVLGSLGDFVRTLAYLGALVLLIGAIAHGLAWLLTRRRTAAWVWGAWNGLGAALLVLGTAATVYAWLGLGLETTLGGLLAALGVLVASAGLWMLVPV